MDIATRFQDAFFESNSKGLWSILVEAQEWATVAADTERVEADALVFCIMATLGILHEIEFAKVQERWLQLNAGDFDSWTSFYYMQLSFQNDQFKDALSAALRVHKHGLDHLYSWIRVLDVRAACAATLSDWVLFDESLVRLADDLCTHRDELENLFGRPPIAAASTVVDMLEKPEHGAPIAQAVSGIHKFFLSIDVDYYYQSKWDREIVEAIRALPSHDS